MSFHPHANKFHFHIKGFALDLTLKQRQTATRKWPISLMPNLVAFQVDPGIVFSNSVVISLAVTPLQRADFVRPIYFTELLEDERKMKLTFSLTRALTILV